MTTEEKIHTLVAAIRQTRNGLPAILPQWDDDQLLTPLVLELNTLLADLQIAQEQATFQRNFFECILNQLPTDFALLDDGSRYLFMSAHAVPDRALREWLIGKTDLDFCAFRGIDDTLAQNRIAKHREALEGSQPIQLLEIRPDRHGKMIHKLRTFMPIQGDHGQRLIAAFSHDITDLALQEQSLLAKNEALEKANFELDQFVYRASHDLRAPLSSVQGLLELVFGAKSLEEAEPYLQLMQRATVKMDGFIRDIVHHSKNARQEIQLAQIDLQAAFDDTMEQLRFMAGADRVSVELKLTATAPLLSDQFRIGILLNNLISNGIKYQDPKKEAHVWVDVVVDAQFVNIRVRDNGIGIAEKHLKHVFEMFYRATHVATGTGIGLYIVQEVARKLGGHAELHSELGVGTTFSVQFQNGHLVE